VPPEFIDHEDAYRRGGVPKDIYFARLQAGESAEQILYGPYLTWDASWPTTYLGHRFRTHYELCDHLEATGVIHPPTKSHLEGPPQLAERDVLAWLDASGYLSKPDAQAWVMLVAAQIRPQPSPTP
jgi:hypothetical protein